MKLFRAFVFLASTALFGACGEGMPESSSHEDPQQQADMLHQDQERQMNAAQEHAKDPDVDTLATSDYIYPQETKTFATNWFSRTWVNVHNPNSNYVLVQMSCARYATNRSLNIAPGTTWRTSVPCEGTTLNIHNDAPLGSGLSVYATVDN